MLMFFCICFCFCVLATVIIQAISVVVVGIFALPSCTLVKVKSESDE